jgi:hypothetical protein
MPAKKKTVRKSARNANLNNTKIAPAAKSPQADNPFTDIWNKFKDAVKDIATVDVTTFQGNVTVELSPEEKFNPSAFFEKLQGKIRDGSTLTLVAHTHVDFDLDAVFITKPDADAKLLEAHNSAVKAAVDARMSVVRMAKDFV